MGASIQRPKPGFLPPGENVLTNHCSILVEIEVVMGKFTLKRVPNAEYQQFAETLSKQDRKRISARADKLVARLILAIKAMK
jgi:hypothetical protein